MLLQKGFDLVAGVVMIPRLFDAPRMRPQRVRKFSLGPEVNK